MIRAIWSCTTALVSAATAAAPTNAELGAYKEAGKSLASLISSAETGAKLRDLRGPELARLVDAIADERILGSAPYRASELGTIMDICDVANKASMSLIMFHLKAHVDPKRTPPEIASAITPLVKNNSLEFQDELAKLQPFVFRCLAREVAPLTEFVHGLKPQELTDARRQGLAQARSGLLELFRGALGAATDPSFRHDCRFAFLRAGSPALRKVPAMRRRIRISD
jgi:hypothetical protein